MLDAPEPALTFRKDARCPACHFPQASEYRDAEGNVYVQCGHCNWDTRAGSSPTPAEAVPRDWKTISEWAKAEMDWLGVDPVTYHWLLTAPSEAKQRLVERARECEEANG